jgi:thiamine-monophosphate kinase
MSPKFHENDLHQLFASHFSPREGILGPGDDCAILVEPPKHLCVSSDQLIEGVHFDSRASLKQIAEKLVGRCLSDLAAMGAKPYAAILNCTFPEQFSVDNIVELSQEILRVADSYDLPIVGGDCSRSQLLHLSCTVMGEGHSNSPLRSGAKVGDHVFVSRPLGGSVSSGRHLNPSPELELGRYLVEHYPPNAMMDISDGLDNDLFRLIRASNVGVEIDTSSIPLNDGCDWENAVTEGEDYGLIVVLPPIFQKEVNKDVFFSKHPLWCIGEVVLGSQLKYTSNGNILELQKKPFNYEWNPS